MSTTCTLHLLSLGVVDLAGAWRRAADEGPRRRLAAATAALPR